LPGLSKNSEFIDLKIWLLGLDNEEVPAEWNQLNYLPHARPAIHLHQGTAALLL
jgi:hypothetical protein